MKKILITTDFSVDSKYTLQYVLDLLHNIHIPCTILLVNTYIVQQTDPSKIIAMYDEIKSNSKAGLEKQRVEAMKGITNENISIEIASHLGTLTNVILHLFSSNKIDMVAMGKNGGKHVESVAALLTLKHCPLLITHAEREYDQVV